MKTKKELTKELCKLINIHKTACREVGKYEGFSEACDLANSQLWFKTFELAPIRREKYENNIDLADSCAKRIEKIIRKLRKE